MVFVKVANNQKIVILPLYGVYFVAINYSLTKYCYMVKKGLMAGMVVLFLLTAILLSFILPISVHAQSTQTDTNSCYQQLVQELTTNDGFDRVFKMVFNENTPTENTCDIWLYELIRDGDEWSNEGIQTFINAIDEALGIVKKQNNTQK